MKLNFAGLALLSTLILVAFAAWAQIETTKLRKQAEIRITTFNHQLNATLAANIELGGLKRGVSGCDSIAKNMAVQSTTGGWRLSRTSLKVRNPKNAPTPWEEYQLTAFAKSYANGKPLSALKVEKLTSLDAETVKYKYMKGIVAEPVCLNCHGESLLPEVVGHLNRDYPNDKAIGYKLGDLMGAFALEKTVKIK